MAQNIRQLREIAARIEAKRADIARNAAIMAERDVRSMTDEELIAYIAELERADPVGMAALSRMTDAELIAIIRKGGK